MKVINLLSIVQAFESLSLKTFQDFLTLNNIQVKIKELKDLKSLLQNFTNTSNDFKTLNNWIIGYRIPQISKEFDLLRFGSNYNINIELKSKSTSEKIKKQLNRNNYYLGFLKQESYCFTYVTEENRLYTLDKDNNLITIRNNDFMALLINQVYQEIPDVDKLFDPSNYLVSPFNSTIKFIEGKYFLTAQQEEIKKKGLEKLDNVTTSFIAICGKAGTGKTLLTYDIVRSYLELNKSVIIFHCGNLNAGHYTLKEEYNWEIKPIKQYKLVDYQQYDLIVIDETQRIYPNQLEVIIESMNKLNGKCIFSYDSNQWLRKWEMKNNIDGMILNQIATTKYKLTEKIRTNREIASFIKCLFDESYSKGNIVRSNIELHYFNTYLDAQKLIFTKADEDWKIINYTPSIVDTHPYEKFEKPFEENAHAVIGQEFEKVVAVIDSHFFYKNQKLSTTGYSKKPYYHPAKMLYQIVTRTQKKLCLIIINNETVLKRCLEVLN